MGPPAQPRVDPRSARPGTPPPPLAASPPHPRPPPTLRGGGLMKVGLDRDRRVVVDQVEAPELLPAACNGCADVAGVGDVAGVEDRPPACLHDRACRRLAGGLVSVEPDDRGSLSARLE